MFLARRKRLTNLLERCIIYTESTRGAKKNKKSEENKMRKYDLTSIMKRAWEIVKTMVGDTGITPAYAGKSPIVVNVSGRTGRGDFKDFVLCRASLE